MLILSVKIAQADDGNLKVDSNLNTVDIENVKDTSVLDGSKIRVTNKLNGFQSQVVDVNSRVDISKILRNCLKKPYQIIDPITINTTENLKFFNPLSGQMYSPNWEGMTPNEISSKFPVTNSNAYIKTLNTEMNFPFIFRKYNQDLTIDFVKYQTVDLKQYEHYIPSLIGFGFRAKLRVESTGAELDVAKITGIQSLFTLQHKKEIIDIKIQELGVTSPALIDILQRVNGAKNINEKLEALSKYQENMQKVLDNPDLSTKITPVIFSQKLQCSSN